MYIDFDLYSFPSLRVTINEALTTWNATLSSRIHLEQDTDASAYSVILFHPGVITVTTPDLKPRDLACIAVRIQPLLKRSLSDKTDSTIAVYIFDSSNAARDPVFLGGATTKASHLTNDHIQYLPEASLAQVSSGCKRIHKSVIRAASKKWTLVVVQTENSSQSSYAFIIVGSCIIFVACLGLAYIVTSSLLRVDRMNRLKSQTEDEKTRLLVEHAKAERELNDFIAHEVRNPLAAAISALSFVSTSVHADPPLRDMETVRSVREDLEVIDGSLRFINDLLRSMLDVHRAASKQMKLDKKETNMLKDIFQPVALMIYTRGDDVQVLIDCPGNLIVSVDTLRLTQIVLNLARNSSKFVTTGFVRLRVEVIDHGTNVLVSVEDSGLGIPMEKRDKLFSKFQESLDVLNQGTGIGLCLCKYLVDLMGGEIRLDLEFDSGVEGFRGTRFAVILNTPPVHAPGTNLSSSSETASSSEMSLRSEGKRMTRGSSKVFRDLELPPLPERASILVVDDDKILRKLFTRLLKRLKPRWRVEEACSGEESLELVDGNTFDVIFMDQYMSSSQKQLLGTETVAELRRKGVNCVICGLSANDIEGKFLESGADSFLLKPVPSGNAALENELRRVFCGRRNQTTL